ncbi:MAG: AAA family ATPase, partial [Desulfobacterales bacterium]
YMEKHTVSRLIGSPPGYVGYGEGGILTEAVRRRPYSAVLLDEAEKANQEVINLFYQVFDKGELADGEGRNIDFKNTVIFLTSNLGADIILQMAASEENLSCEQIVSAIRPVLSAHFKPALLARMRIIPYMPLGADVMEQIVEIKLQRLQHRVKQVHNIVLECTGSVISQIAQRCLEVETGARNIDHIMEGTILPLVSKEILSGFTSGSLPGQITLASAEDGSFVLHLDQDNKETAIM